MKHALAKLICTIPKKIFNFVVHLGSVEQIIFYCDDSDQKTEWWCDSNYIHYNVGCKSNGATVEVSE